MNMQIRDEPRSRNLARVIYPDNYLSELSYIGLNARDSLHGTQVFQPVRPSGFQPDPESEKVEQVKSCLPHSQNGCVPQRLVPYV
jgi:hypothetical protein